MTTALSIIIPWCDRPEIVKTIYHNAHLFDHSNTEYIIVNCGGNQEVLMSYLAQLDVKFKIIEYKRQFNKSLALNIGVYHANHERILFLDTDILLDKDFIPSALLLLAEHKQFVTLQHVIESVSGRKVQSSYISLISYCTQIITHNEKTINLVTNKIDLAQNSRSAPGIIMLMKHNFLSINGMNSNLTNWGWEDLDLIARLQLKLDLIHQHTGKAVHLTHSDEQRQLNNLSRAEAESKNYSICIKNYLNGQYSGTYDVDVKHYLESVM